MSSGLKSFISCEQGPAKRHVKEAAIAVRNYTPGCLISWKSMAAKGQRGGCTHPPPPLRRPFRPPTGTRHGPASGSAGSKGAGDAPGAAVGAGIPRHVRLVSAAAQQTPRSPLSRYFHKSFPRSGILLGARQPAACYMNVSGCIACTYQEIRLGRGMAGGKAGSEVQM